VFQGQKIIWKNKDEDDNRTLLWYPMPEGKKHILKMLCDGNEQEFVNYIANHVSLMCGFIPILDKLFTSRNSFSRLTTPLKNLSRPVERVAGVAHTIPAGTPEISPHTGPGLSPNI